MANIHSQRSLEQLQLTLNLTQELEAAGSKVLVYLPDGGDCSSKDECAARFLIHILDPFLVSLSPFHFHLPEGEDCANKKESHHPIHLVIKCHALIFVTALESMPIALRAALIRCAAGSEDQAHCTGSRQEVIEREGGIWGSNPDKNPFHDYFKVTLDYPMKELCSLCVARRWTI